MTVLVIFGCSYLLGYMWFSWATRGGREGVAKRERLMEEKRHIDYWARVAERTEILRDVEYKAYIERETSKRDAYDIEARTRVAVALVKETAKAEATARAREKEMYGW
jgi:hypothetical protein